MLYKPLPQFFGQRRGTSRNRVPVQAGGAQGRFSPQRIVGRRKGHIDADAGQQHAAALFQQNARQFTGALRQGEHQVIRPFEQHGPASGAQGAGQQQARDRGRGRAVKGRQQGQTQGGIDIARRRHPVPPQLPAPRRLADGLDAVPNLQPPPPGQQKGHIQTGRHLAETPDKGLPGKAGARGGHGGAFPALRAVAY